MEVSGGHDIDHCNGHNFWRLLFKSLLFQEMYTLVAHCFQCVQWATINNGPKQDGVFCVQWGHSPPPVQRSQIGLKAGPVCPVSN